MAMSEGTNLECEVIRLIQKHEPGELLDLYKHLNMDDPELVADVRLKALWDEILVDPRQHYLVAEVDGKASLTLRTCDYKQPDSRWEPLCNC